ncbi:FAD-dependent oxidoreductase [Hoyosella sp. YIM 151337]|uniref:GMC family oxidoreductase n=1 Tax=Hoyosella sp. YIM 151337 TaxID=2992742 RepID=UPI002236B3E6|nr:FAD-dependent oxidoreductase [Hoyosella sp. YIM 151337]MCW4355743.1 FAD-dependent oxidoreductase [Hoyosella sp. YIM 151337]
MSEADYVVVGAGSAGCVVASRLAEQGANVTLIEAGRKDSSRFVRTPGMISIVHTVPQVKKRFDWGYYTVPQKHAADRKIPHTRGKVLGGSSSINGMLFVRGNRANYDSWAAEGCDGWSYDDVLPAYKRLEDWEGGADEHRGAGGPIKVTRQRDVTDASLRFMDALAATTGAPLIDDYNGPEQEGIGIFQQSASNGLRYSSSRGYLGGAPRLTVETGVTATRVAFTGNRATGVEVLDKSGIRIISAAREVILAAGVFGSPQLLMLSGIGPAEQLRDFGIRVRQNLPVGKNLHDHLFVPMTFLMPSALHRGTPLHFLSGMVQESTRGNSWFGRTVFEAAGFLRTSFASTVPDLQIHTLPWSYPTPNQDLPVRHKVDTRPALTIFPTLIYPHSRGEVRLASADPTAAPLIDPAYLSEPADADLLVEGIQLIREVMAHKDIAHEVRGEFAPGPAFLSETALRRELPTRIHSVYHPVGTCRMGTDERAVVDPQLKVLGVEGLRVADASIMPSITGGNTNAPAMMIGERCADLLS